MEWESIKQKWGEMALRVRSPALGANANTEAITDPESVDNQAGNQPAGTAPGSAGTPAAQTPDERSAV